MGLNFAIRSIFGAGADIAGAIHIPMDQIAEAGAGTDPPVLICQSLYQN
jgi:rhodanese-related sulfurtransferase